MSASNINEKNKAFHRLLHDLNQDSLHNETEEEREHLPRMAQSASLAELRDRLRKRYRRSRLSPNLMYMPRVALTFAILLTCAVTYLYIDRLRLIEQQKEQQKQQQIHVLDSLLRQKKNEEKH